MANRILRDWTWFMRDLRVSPYNLVLKGPRLEGFEADVLKISPLGYTIEYEIKIARNDYMADFLKTKWVSNGPLTFDSPSVRVFKHDVLKTGLGANKFYFVVPDGMIKLTEVPPYTGLIYTNSEDFRIIKPAPTLGNIRRQSMYERYKNSLNG